MFLLKGVNPNKGVQNMEEKCETNRYMTEFCNSKDSVGSLTFKRKTFKMFFGSK